MKFNALLIILLAGTICSSCQSGIEEFDSSPHKIEVDEAYTLYKNYHSRFNSPIKEIQLQLPNRESEEYYPTEYVWVSLEDLKGYIRMLDEVAAKNEPISGVAIYLGAYGTEKQVEGDNAKKLRVPRSGDYAGRITNFMAPTYADQGNYAVGMELNKHKPFYIVPDNGENPYVGQYAPLDFTYPEIIFPTPEEEDTTPPTSLNFNDLNAMPPKKAGSGGNN